MSGRYNVRSLLPKAARERLYELHPGRARRWRRYPGIERVDPIGHAVLTFDDGPDEDATPAVLDRLDEVGARATFFILGDQLEVHGEIAHEVLRRGHEVGLHGYGHERQDRLEGDRSGEDVRRGFRAVEDALGRRCSWYRPPYGKMSDSSLAACKELGMTTVYWSAWGLDWELVGPQRIADVTSAGLRDGSIILLHDSARYARRRSALTTAEALPMIAERARAAGIALVSLGDAVTAAEGLAA